MTPPPAPSPSPSPSSSSTVAQAMTQPKTSMDEFHGILELMRTDASARLVNYYYGAKLVYNPGLAGKIISRISKNMGQKAKSLETYQVVESTKALELIRSTVSDIMDGVQKAMGSTATDAGISATVMRSVGERATQLATSAFGATFVAEATPFIGLLPSAYKAVTKSYAAVDGIIKAVHASRYAEAVVQGNPRLAAAACHTILSRKAKYLTSGAATSLTNLGMGIANAASTGIATAVDVSVKTATAIVDLIAELTMFGIEMYEHSAGEQQLQSMAQSGHVLGVDNKLIEPLVGLCFNQCPLLGCYMLASAPYFNTSDFVTLMSDKHEIASVDEIERIAQKNVNPLRLYASQIISESKIKLTHTKNEKLDKIMKEAVMRAEAAENKSLKGQVKQAINKHIVEPLKAKVASVMH